VEAFTLNRPVPIVIMKVDKGSGDNCALLRLALHHMPVPAALEAPASAPMAFTVPKPATPVALRGWGVPMEPTVAAPTSLVAPAAPPEPATAQEAQRVPPAELEGSAAAQEAQQQQHVKAECNAAVQEAQLVLLAEPEGNVAAQEAQRSPQAKAEGNSATHEAQQVLQVASSHQIHFPIYATQQHMVMQDCSAVEVTLQWNLKRVWPGTWRSGAVASLAIGVDPWLEGSKLQIQLPDECEVVDIWNAGVTQLTADNLLTLKLAPWPAETFGCTFCFPNLDVYTASEKLMAMVEL